MGTDPRMHGCSAIDWRKVLRLALERNKAEHGEVKAPKACPTHKPFKRTKPHHGCSELRLEHWINGTDAAHRETDKRLSQLEGELRANEERWGAVMANPFMGITVLDRNQYFIMANSTFQEMVGYTNDELKKLTPLDITPAGEREINSAFFEELQEGKRQHFELIKRLQRKDGKLIWIQLYVFKIPGSGIWPAHICHGF